MESFANDATLSESEVVRMVLAFLEDRGLYLSLDALERESGGLLAQGQLPPKAAYLRQLVVSGKWTEAAASLRSLLPDPNAALFHLFRQKYLELICVYEELGNELCDDLGHAVALCFSELSACCPSLDERDELRQLARLSRPSRDPSMRDWDPLSGRRRCFEALLPLLTSVEETPSNTESPVDPSRLTDLISKGLLYEAEKGPLPVDVRLQPLSRREATDESWTEFILMRSDGEGWPGRESFLNRRIQDGLVDGAPEILRRAEEIISRWEARYRPPVINSEGDSKEEVESGTDQKKKKEKTPSREENVVRGDTCVPKVEEESSTAKEEGVVERGLSRESKAREVLKGKKKATSKVEAKIRNLQVVANRVLNDAEKTSTEDVAKAKRNLPLVDLIKGKEKPSREDEAKTKRNLPLGDLIKGKEKPSREDEAKTKRNLPLVDPLKGKEKTYREVEARAKRNSPLVDLIKGKEKPSREDEVKTKRNLSLVDPLKGKEKPSVKKGIKVKQNLTSVDPLMDKEKPSKKEEEDKVKRNLPLVDHLKGKEKPFREEEIEDKPSLPLVDQLKDKHKNYINEESGDKRELTGDRVLEVEEEGKIKWDYLKEVDVSIPSSHGAEEKQTVRDLLQAKDRVREKLLQILNNDKKDSKQ